jgi:IclR family mhp operon transcriptional activator
MDSRQEVKSLKKALRALVVLNEQGEATVTDVAASVGLPRPTAYRLLETLASEGYVEKQENSTIYRLTSQVRNLAAGFSDRDLAVEVAKPLIKDLGRALGWPIALATPVATDMVVRITTDYENPRAIDRFMVGFNVPMLHAPAGYCYLAFCAETDRQRVVRIARLSPDPRQRLARHPDRLDQLLNRVRDDGFCTREYAAYREGGLAIPLLINGTPIGGVVMRYVKSAMKIGQLQTDYLPELKKLSDRINAAFNARTQDQLRAWPSTGQVAGDVGHGDFR